MKKVNLTKIFPTVTLESILNDNILYFVDKFKNQEEVIPILVYLFDTNYYIIDGHHRMLASAICGNCDIDVIELEKDELPNWCDDKIFTSTLNSLGMRTIYDFEAIGNFSYDEYSKYYKKQEN